MIGEIKMAEVAAAHSTTSGKIRALAGHGLSRRQIADYLGKSYQHVRQVLVDSERRRTGGAVRASSTPATHNDLGFAMLAKGEAAFRVTSDADGRLMIPPEAAKALGLEAGKSAIGRIQHGELVIMSAEQAMRKAQEIVRAFIPANVSLVDELIAERRQLND